MDTSLSPFDPDGLTPKAGTVPATTWFIGTLAVLVALAWLLGTAGRTTNTNYFNYLADAFNHGSLHLINAPRSTHDLTIVDGKLFLYWGPIPAVVLCPIVALFGISWPDTWITLVLGASLSTLVLVLVRKTTSIHGLTGLSPYLLVVVLTFGSPVLPLALSGGVWATSQLFAATFLAAGLCAGFGYLTTRATLAASTLIGLACLCRPSMAGAVPWLLYRILQDGRTVNRKETLRQLAFVSAVFCVCIGLQLGYNYLRFGNILETGFSTQNIDRKFRLGAALHGQLSIAHLPRNLFFHYLAYPYPYSKETWWGGSLFLMTPLYFGAFFTLIRKAASRDWVWPLWIACVLIALPSLMVNGTGWIQLGPRYTVDYAPFLVVLVATGIASWPTWLIILSSLLSFAHYAYGVILFIP